MTIVVLTEDGATECPTREAAAETLAQLRDAGYDHAWPDHDLPPEDREWIVARATDILLARQ